MPTGFADAFLESVFKGRAENAERQRFNAQMQFEQAKTFQQQQIEKQRLENEKMYQQALIKDAQDKTAQQGKQFQQTFDANQAAQAFNLQAQGLATPVQPQMNLLGTGAPLQGPPPSMEAPPLGVPQPELSDLPVQTQPRQGALAQAPPGATQFGTTFLQPRTVEERAASEHKTKLEQDAADKAQKYADNLQTANDFVNDPANGFSTAQKQAFLTHVHLSNMADKTGASVGDLKAILNPGGTPSKLTKDEQLAAASKIIAGIDAPEMPGVDVPHAKALYDLLKPPKTGNESSTLNRNYRSFEDSKKELERVSKATIDQSEVIRKARVAVNSNNGAIDPFIAPAMNALFSRRQSEAELKRINGGQATVDKANLAWQNILQAKSITDDQKKAFNEVLNSLDRQLKPRQMAVKKAYDALDPDSNPKVHSDIMKTFKAEFGDEDTTPLDQGGAQGGLDVNKIKSFLPKK